MSIILDALRKSETERQRQAGPGIADAGYRPPARRRSLWLPLLVIVLAANLVIIAYMLLRDRGAPPVEQATVEAAAPATITTPAPPGPPAARQQIEVLREDAPYQAMADLPAMEPEAGTGAAAVAPGTSAIPAPAAADAAAATALIPAPAAGVPPDTGSVRSGLPTAEQLVAQGELSLPPLRVDIHVFSENIAERFVFINMRKYTEGAQLSEGPRVEEITSEGVVLSQGGLRFMLTRD
jgi:general secretion pathway protein B